MHAVFDELRQYARAVAQELGRPSFYDHYDREVQQALDNINHDPTLVKLKQYVLAVLEDDYGHGIRHSMLVTRDTGALVLIGAQRAGFSRSAVPIVVRSAQAAGLLHDIRRKEANHAMRSAEAARQVLDRFLFGPEEIEDIVRAIANHEAFKTPVPLSSERGQLISDCLYDADKFRWGPDNFTDTVWAMASFYNVTLERFSEAYSHGVEAIVRIKQTFRTATGRRYGPEMIEMGLAIGERVMEVIRGRIAAL